MDGVKYIFVFVFIHDLIYLYVIVVFGLVQTHKHSNIYLIINWNKNCINNFNKVC